MGRPKKEPTGLSIAEKKYITLALEKHNNVNYDELFKRMAIELDRDERIIRDYADRLTPTIKDEQLPPEPTPRKLQPHQDMARNLLTPNRLTESNKARHVTVMSEMASSQIEQIPAAPIKGSSKISSSIFRQ